jgi:hypothetical protein
MNRKSILVVSGCMALQDQSKGNIDHSSLYHHIVKKQGLEDFDISLDFEILRSERFSTCLPKLKEAFRKKTYDMVIFQVRGNHYLKTIKLFGFYTDSSTQTRKLTFNLLRWRESAFEEHKPAITQSSLKKSSSSRSLYSRFLRALKTTFHQTNSAIGLIVGNQRIAYRTYLGLIKAVIEFSTNNLVPIMFIGVTSRPNNKIENHMAKNLNRKISQYLRQQQHTYVDIFGDLTSDGVYKFSSDFKISLNEYGHQELANKLLPLLVEAFAKGGKPATCFEQE